MIQIETFHEYLKNLQSTLCEAIEGIDLDHRFRRDNWIRAQGGGGLTCVLQHGDVFDSAGVNLSYVYGDSLPKSATLARPELAGRSFKALGVSSVIHPANPFVPTAHLNVRAFIAEKKGEEPIGWFGGGFDLTPYYGFKEDCIHWHQVAKAACDPFGKEVYPTYKKWADDYFFLPHRSEPRGIGGLFFDDLNESTWGWDIDKCMKFTQSIGRAFSRAYLPIVRKRMVCPYSEREMMFQRLRRGRYVEFNLIHDRGTLFGLQSGGRTESILMSLPTEVSWLYNFIPEEGSPEEQLFTDFHPIQDWASMETHNGYLTEILKN